MNWFGQNPAEMSGSVDALLAAAAERNNAINDYRVAQAVARWKAHNTNEAVQIDASTPAPIADFMRTIGVNEWRRTGNRAPANHAAVFVYFDTSTIAGAGSPNNPRTAELRRPVDVWYALPEATDGERCVVLVRIRDSTVAQLTDLGERSLLGPCAYFAAFGKPGRAVHQWLEATNYRGIRVPDWDMARAPTIDEASLYTLTPEARWCLTGKPGGCARALNRHAVPGPATRVVDGNTSGEASRHRTLRLGDASPRFLADAVRELGAPRFAQFWTSSAPLDSAFAGAASMPLDDWTAHWLERSYGKPKRLAVVRDQDILWFAILIPVLMLVAAGRRERVLVDRFRVSPLPSS
jgi:hypothetical protein